MALEFGNQTKSYVSELVRLNKYNLIAFAYQKLTVNGTAAALTVPDGAKYADITLESTVTASVPVRYLISGTPTATDGKALNHLTTFDVQGTPNLNMIKFIQTGAGTHTLHIEYYR